MSSPTLNALVHTMRYEADGIVSVEFRPATPAVDFPAFEAGSHIDLHLPNGLVRSYSLCNPASDRQRYVVGVLNDRKSRGGSRYVHQQLRVGMTLPISAPRNNFALEEDARRSVLVAGGIGVTPIWCMLQRLALLGRPVELVYCARSRKEAAFVEAIEALARDKSIQLSWHFDDEKGAPPDLAKLLAGRGDDSHYYCWVPRRCSMPSSAAASNWAMPTCTSSVSPPCRWRHRPPRKAAWWPARRASARSRCPRASRSSTA